MINSRNIILFAIGCRSILCVYTHILRPASSVVYVPLPLPVGLLSLVGCGVSDSVCSVVSLLDVDDASRERLPVLAVSVAMLTAGSALAGLNAQKRSENGMVQWESSQCEV